MSSQPRLWARVSTLCVLIYPALHTLACGSNGDTGEDEGTPSMTDSKDDSEESSGKDNTSGASESSESESEGDSDTSDAGGSDSESGMSASDDESSDSGSEDTIDPEDLPEMMEIPAGSFRMGCDEENLVFGDRCEWNQVPVHEVYLDAYAIDTFEVTLEAWYECVDAGECPPIGDSCKGVWPWRAPVPCVSWNQARHYCEWRGKRLPTEAEWEKAARGDTETYYPWGNERPTCPGVAMALRDDDGDSRNEYWCGDDENGWPVGTAKLDVSPYGVRDMAGSMHEYTADWYDEDYYATSPTDNPQGPEEHVDRMVKVLRGGSYKAPYFKNRGLFSAVRRSSTSINGGDDTTAFRCAKSL